MKFLIALLTAATGVLHLLVGFGLIGDGVTNWLLVLNGVGYLVLLVLFWMSSGNGGTIRWILLAYTLITLIGYFVINAGSNFGLNNTIGLIIKAIELLLVTLLFLYRGPEKARVTSPAPAASRMGTGMDATRTGTTVSTAAASASAGASIAPAAVAAAAVSMADEADSSVNTLADEAAEMASDAGDAVGDAVEEMGETAEDAVDSAAEMASDAGDAVGDVVEEMGETAEDAVDAAGDMAGDAAEAVGDGFEAAGVAAVGAAAYVADKAEDATDATADMVGDAADAVGDMADGAENAIDTSGDALRSGSLATGVVAADVMGASDEEIAAQAAALDEAAMAAEPSAEDLRAELETYLRSFGPSSEFRKEIEYVEGIGAVYGQKLRGIGISTILDLMVNGATRRGRKHIADESGISQSLILTWVNHVDLFRIKGVAQEYADLLEQSGVDTVVELAQRNPANLHKRMLDINEQKSLVRRAPHASEVQSWVEQAKNLRRLIHY